MIKNILLILFIISISNSAIVAQDDKLDSESVEIVKKFEAQLAESDKLDISPSLPPVDSSNRVATYQINAQPLLITYPAPDIKPIAMKSDELPPVKSSFFKGGAGIPNMYYGEVSHFGEIAERVNIGAGANYYRADNSNNKGNQKFINTDVFLQGAYKIEEDAYLQTKVDFSERIDHFFGYDDEVISVPADQVKQRFRTFSMGTSYLSPENDIEKLNYGGSVNLFTHGDLYDSKEKGLALTAKAKKFLKREHPVALEIIGDFSNFKDSTDHKQSLNNLTFRPTASFHAEKFKVLIGGNLVFHDSTFTALPIIEAIANIAGNKLVAFAGWEGNVVKNTYRSLTEYNPYLISNPNIFNSTYNDYYGGLKGKIKTVNYVAKAGYKTVNILPLFVQSMVDTKRFDIITDEAKIFYIEGAAEVTFFKKLNVAAVVSKSFFDLETQQQPWHIPSFELNVNANYTMMDDKLMLKADFFSANPVANISTDFEIEYLNTLLDLSVGAEYWVNETFGAWIDLNNLTANKYERWKGYRTFGTNFMGGVVVKF